MFTPHTNKDVTEMLKTIGIVHLSDLFTDIPEEHQYPELALPKNLSEMEVMSLLQEISSANESLDELYCFLGAGAYNHFCPAIVDSFLRSGDFYSAYTPYQPEISQGTLQAIFEYQTLIANLTGMDASNASHYDGATSMAEAALLAYYQYRGKRKKFIVSNTVHPHYREVLFTYLEGLDNLEVLVCDPAPEKITALLDENTAMVFVQYPDFLGNIWNFSDLADHIHEFGSMFCVAANPIALALYHAPGDFDADVVVGEGQPLGIPLSYGGPYLGFFATKKKYIRKISGRLVGETIDQDGNKGYVLTLTAREQHIRREKATSNICTNQGLLALGATIYLSAVGKQGLIDVANLCYQKAHYAATQIEALPGYHVANTEPFFNEFVVECPVPVNKINSHLLEHGILGGLDIASFYPKFDNPMLIAFTEMNDKSQIDYLLDVLQEVAHD
ncbi:MAG: aminomethyl-transferring glycine dehydrogenase subunit GcvPA [Anaerolineaceae bacterium]|nr:aminomethyl-transferring glycine dehydrogenase subunit GcvPA [Anaerolineaceae bacterium]